ncbi:hypothetical protein TWF506_005346 [Arthrobotrys conoides]|uniref:Uncharacterized protein n=1 Tax=Arthrobotrys conoides TaxID=74498 RepID=A0AAN8RWS0_9PEZI
MSSIYLRVDPSSGSTFIETRCPRDSTDSHRSKELTVNLNVSVASRRHRFRVDVERNSLVIFRTGRRSYDRTRNGPHSGQTYRTVSTRNLDRHFDSDGNQTIYRQELTEISNDGHLYMVCEHYAIPDSPQRRPRGYIEEIPVPSRSGSDGEDEAEEVDYDFEVEEPVQDGSRHSRSSREGCSYHGGSRTGSVPNPPPTPRAYPNYNPPYNSRSWE